MKTTPIKISKETIRIPKPQPKKLRIVRNGKDGKTPTKEELLELIKPLIPEIPPQVVKNTPKKALERLIEEYIANKPLTPPTVDFYMKETDAGTEVTINGVMHLIPRAVYGPKLRNLQQMGDVSVTNPSEGEGLVFKDGYWKNETIGELDTLQTVTDRGNTTTNDIGVNGVQFDITPTATTPAEGLLQWNSTDGTLDLGMDGGAITMQIGQELFTKVRNPNGNPVITNGQAVYISGRTGAFPDVSLARSDSDTTSKVLGVATQTITAPDFGYITTSGYVRGIKTDYTGAGIWGTTWVMGDILYVSKTNAGTLTNVEPAAPHHSDIVGTVGIVHSNLGSILITLDRHKTLEELTDVNGTPLTTTGQFPSWNNTTQYFDFDKNINNYQMFSYFV